jgi:putative ABC transport system ATP-binding protein
LNEYSTKPTTHRLRSAHRLYTPKTLRYICDARSTTYAVRHVSLEVGARDYVGIVGPSGSGKSSLLYLLSGLRTATDGAVYINGFKYSHASANEKLDFRRKHFGFVFQQPFLIPYLSVIEKRAGAD